MNLNDRNMSNKGRRRLPLTRTFRHHVPYDDMRKFRVDLETTDDVHPHPLSERLDDDLSHPVGFRVVLYKGYAKKVESEEVGLQSSLEYLSIFADRRPQLESRISDFLQQVNSRLSTITPDATTLQAIRSRRFDSDEPLEYEILETIASLDTDDNRSSIVDDLFPKEEFEEMTIEFPHLIGGTDLPARVLLKLVAANYVAYKLNHCGHWFRNTRDEVYIPDEVDDEGVELPVELSCSRYGPLDGCIEQLFERLAADPVSAKPAFGHAD